MSEEVAEQDEALIEESPEVSDEPKEYNIFEDSEEELSADSESEPEPEPEAEVSGEDKKRDSASWKVKKDRQQRQKEIDLKRKSQEISEREQRISEMGSAVEGFRDKFLDNPEEAFDALGLDPMEVYQFWTRRMVSGEEEKAPADLRLTSTEDRVHKLEAEIERRDAESRKMAEERQKDHAINSYIGEIRDFIGSTDEFPLTKEQCSPEDIAKGIAAYHHNSGEQLSFQEACTKIEEGLAAEEKNLFEDPAIIAKFKKFHGLDAEVKQGRVASKTLSSKMNTRPTRVSSEELTLDEIKAKYANQLFT